MIIVKFWKSCSSNLPSNRQSHNWDDDFGLTWFKNLTFPHLILAERLTKSQYLSIEWFTQPRIQQLCDKCLSTVIFSRCERTAVNKVMSLSLHSSCEKRQNFYVFICLYHLLTVMKWRHIFFASLFFSHLCDFLVNFNFLICNVYFIKSAFMSSKISSFVMVLGDIP